MSERILDGLPIEAEPEDANTIYTELHIRFVHRNEFDKLGTVLELMRAACICSQHVELDRAIRLLDEIADALSYEVVPASGPRLSHMDVRTGGE